MGHLKLPKLPDRTPVKLSIMVLPELHNILQDYAEAYASYYGERVPISDLIPSILEQFIASDRTFLRQNKRQSIP